MQVLPHTGCTRGIARRNLSYHNIAPPSLYTYHNIAPPSLYTKNEFSLLPAFRTDGNMLLQLIHMTDSLSSKQLICILAKCLRLANDGTQTH